MRMKIRISLLLALISPAITLAGGLAVPPASGGCAQRVRAIDDRADLDVREENERIARLRQEKAISAGTPASAHRDAEIRTELAAAQVRRSETLDDQHSDLNVVRKECDLLRIAERDAARALSRMAKKP